MTFSNDLFGTIRTEVIDGNVYFCGLDVARALGYKKPRNAVCRHCHEALKRGSTDSKGRKSVMSFISEGDLYRLITRSELDSAKEFEKWVFEVVLPQIRKTGGYIPVNGAGDDDDVIMARALQIMQRTLEQKNKIITKQEDEIRKLKNSIPMDCAMIAQAQKLLKIKCSEIFGVEYWKDNPEYKVLKNKVFMKFDATKWRDIPAYRYYEVMSYIEKMN